MSTKISNKSKRICCNNKCNWVGKDKETVHPKHWPNDKLCPKCYEVTEIYE